MESRSFQRKVAKVQSHQDRTAVNPNDPIRPVPSRKQDTGTPTQPVPQKSAREQRVEESARRATQMQVLQQMGAELASDLDLNTLLNTILQRAVELLGASVGGLYLYQAEQDVLRQRVSIGDSPEVTNETRQRGQGLTGDVWERGQPMVVNDYRRWSERDTRYDEYPTRAVIGVPIQWSGEFLGVLNIAADPPRIFSANDVELLILFASHAAIAIKNADLHTRLAASEHRYRAISEVISDFAYSLYVGTDDNLKVEWITEAHEQLLGFCYPDQFQIEEILHHFHPEDRESLWRHKAELFNGHPSVCEFRVLHQDGNIRWLRNYVQPEWDAEQKRVIRLIGAAQDITERKLGEEALHTRERYLTLLNNIAQIAIETPDLTTMLQRLADELSQLLKADSCYLTLWDENTDRPIPMAATGESSTVYKSMQILPDEPTMTASVLTAGHSLVVEDVFNTPYLPRRIAALFPARSMLGLPLTAHGQKLGAALITHHQPHHYTQEEIKLGEQAARQIALAVARSGLYAAAQQRARQLDALHVATSALLTTLEMESLINQILSAAIQAIPTAEKGSLLLIDSKSSDLQVRALQGYKDPRVKTTAFVCNRGYTAKAIQQGRPQLIPDARADDSVRYDGEIEEMRAILSAIVAPLVLEGQVLGAISLDSTRLEAFSQTDLQLLDTFAATATAAIHNAQLHAAMQELAITDALTCLYNLRGFFELGEREVERARRFHRSLAALMFDLDHFKRVNDTYGHPIGNQVLAGLAERCHHALREVDLLGRYGGEEFSALLPETDLEQAIAVSERLRMSIAQAPFETEVGPIPITISIGIALLEPEKDDLKSLLAKADRALYLAKNGGRNRACQYIGS